MNGSEQPQQSNDGDGGGMGWLWFILIFGVGNVILYYTTGIVIIPIRK